MIDALAATLRPHYSRFLAGTSEILMTGHSHQAWPDVSREAQLEAWDDAAKLADNKWGKIFGEILPAYRARLAARIGSSTPAAIAIAPNTHELLTRFISCFPKQAAIVTTDGEFHSMRRQLSRLAEEGDRVSWVPTGAGFGARFVDALERERPSCAMLSAVFFGTSEIVVELPEILSTADRLRIPILVDAYHAANVLELEVARWPGDVFVVGGGYKYAAHGEGACWMHVPAGAERLRPRNTGWFADFGGLEAAGASVGYSSGGDRFFGATFDPTALYRGLRVMEWMDRVGLTTSVLRAQSLAQTGRLIERYDALGLEASGLGLATPREAHRRAGFVSFVHPSAKAIAERLAARGVRSDTRGAHLRLGPAPYTTAAELDGAMAALAAALRD